jgi:hypothetical protein
VNVQGSPKRRSGLGLGKKSSSSILRIVTTMGAMWKAWRRPGLVVPRLRTAVARVKARAIS